MIAGIDSQILVYAGLVPKKSGRAPLSEDDKRLSFRATILLNNLKDETVVLPMLAVAELLVPVALSKRGSLITALSEMFSCPDFDEKAAAIAAEIWAKYKTVPADQRYENRHVMRVDALIVASAKSAGATDFYTNDDNCRALANLVMKGRELPTHSEELFIKEMIESGMVELPAKRRAARKKKAKRKKKP